jgi:hypothetical protein
MAKKTSTKVSRTASAKPFSHFVKWCLDSKGHCGEPDAIAFICDTYKREYVLRYAAGESARVARKSPTINVEENVGVRFLEGRPITEREAERLYCRGVQRMLNDIKSTCLRRSKSVSYCRQTCSFMLRDKKECHAAGK